MFGWVNYTFMNCVNTAGVKKLEKRHFFKDVHSFIVPSL